MYYGLSDQLAQVMSKPFGRTVINAEYEQGDTIADKIQNALDKPSLSHRVVYVPPGKHVITRTIKVPSYTTLVLLEGSELILADGVNDRVITNSDYENGNVHVYIVGMGASILDGNGVNQDKELNNYKNIGVHLYNVKHFGISNVTIKSTARWSLVLEAVENGYVNNVTFDLEGYVNQDGVHVIGPSRNVVCDGIFGTFGDDACVVNARSRADGGTGVFQGYGDGGNVEHVIFTNVHMKGLPGPDDGFIHSGILRTSASPSTYVRDIVLSNATGEGVIAGGRLGGNDVPLIQNHANITLENITIKSGKDPGSDSGTDGFGCILYQPVSNLKMLNVHCTEYAKYALIDNKVPSNLPAGHAIDGLTIADCSVRTNYSGARNYIIKLKQASIKNAQITNLRVKGRQAGSNLYAIWFQDCAVENLQIDNVMAENVAGVFLSTAGTTFKNASIGAYASLSGSAAPIDIQGAKDGVTIGGIGEESTDAETPTASKWPIGTIVHFTDTGDGSGSGVYLLFPSLTWAKIGDISQ